METHYGKFKIGSIIKRKSTDSPLRGLVVANNVTYIISWNGREEKPLPGQNIEDIDEYYELDEKYIRNEKLNSILDTDENVVDLSEFVDPYYEVGSIMGEIMGGKTKYT